MAEHAGAIPGKAPDSLRRLDVDEILGLHAYFAGDACRRHDALADFRSAADFADLRKWIPGRRIRFSAGWGTLLTNDFRGCDPEAARLRSAEPDLQSARSGRAAGRETVGQLCEGTGASRGSRTLPPYFRNSRRGQRAGARLTRMVSRLTLCFRTKP